MKIIRGSFHPRQDWKMDPKGYFLIRINKKMKKIEVAHCSTVPKNFGKHKIDTKIYGKNPQEIYFTAAKLGLVSRYDHAAYFGKELEKAYVAMQLGLNYVQDDELLQANTKKAATAKAKSRLKRKK